MLSVSRLMAAERRAQERFRIECPVLVSRREPDPAMDAVKAQLLDIGSRGARLVVGAPLEVGTQVVIELELPSPRRGLTRIRFQGTVLRSQSRHEVAVSFPESGTFLRSGMETVDHANREEADDDE